MSVPIFTPSLGMSGLWRLRTPFADQINPAEIMTCTAVAQIRQLQESGVDVLQDIYLASGLSQADFDRDAAAGNPIATLDNGKEIQVLVPTWAMLGLPEIGGVEYDTFTIMLKLSAMPAATSLDALVVDLTETVTSKLGVVSTGKVMVAGKPTVLTESAHRAATARRESRKKDTGSLIVANAKRPSGS